LFARFTMLDNLANEWGKQYCLLGSKRDRSNCDAENRQDPTMFKQVLHRLCENQFCLAKCCPSGTDANMWSIFDATGSVRSTCGIGVGAYLAGEGNMQCWSTSYFCVKEDICRIMHPSQATDVAKAITLPLPYHIPHLKEKNASTFEISLESLEQQCLEEIHLRCLQFKLEGRPLKTLLMELILASNGSELSASFLERLGTLAKHHEFSIIVDEILTGARACPKLLLTLTKPRIFQNAVAYVNLGKWPGIGICLKNAKHVTDEEPMGPSRGPSTFLRLDKALEALKYVDNQLKIIPSRREAVLKKLRVKEEDTWGKGLLIFVPKRRSDSCRGLKNRYLPMLANSPIDTIPMSGLSPTKEVVDMQIRKDIFAWICHSRMTEPRSYRWLVEKLVDVTKQSNMHEENEKFIGRSELQRYLKEKMSSESSKNHPEQDCTSTITDTTDQEDTTDVSTETLHLDRMERISNTAKHDKNRKHSNKLLFNIKTLKSKKTNLIEYPSKMKADISTFGSKGLVKTNFSRSSNRKEALKTTSLVIPEECLVLEEKVLLQQETENDTGLNEIPLHVIEHALGMPMMESNGPVYENEIPFEPQRSSQGSIAETAKTLLELGSNEENQEKKHIDINQEYLSANTNVNTKGTCGSNGKDTIQERKSSSAASYTVALAETMGFLDYRFASGKKRLRKLKLRNDCCYPIKYNTSAENNS
jgi:hypothetical protein